MTMSDRVYADLQQSETKQAGTLTVWMARNISGKLFLFSLKPERKKDHWITYFYNSAISVDNDHPLGDNLTWEDEPRQVELVRKADDDCYACAYREESAHIMADLGGMINENKVLYETVRLMATKCAIEILRKDRHLGFAVKPLEEETDIILAECRQQAEQNVAAKGQEESA